jgi:hypothetical protein
MIYRKTLSGSSWTQKLRINYFQGLIGTLLVVSWLFLLLGQPSFASPSVPNAVITATRQDLSQKMKIPANQLQVKSATAQTWSDGCLGLANPGEICTQALVEGWRVVLTNNQKTWVYRTDRTGGNLRLEK